MRRTLTLFFIKLAMRTSRNGFTYDHLKEAYSHEEFFS